MFVGLEANGSVLLKGGRVVCPKTDTDAVLAQSDEITVKLGM